MSSSPVPVLALPLHVLLPTKTILGITCEVLSWCGVFTNQLAQSVFACLSKTKKPARTVFPSLVLKASWPSASDINMLIE